MRIDTAAIESLKQFAVLHGEVEFSHLCTAALAGEEWAEERIAPALDEFLEPTKWMGCLMCIERTDCTRPDGTIARAAVIP